MKESPKRQAVVVGLFVTVATTILLGGVLMIGDLNDTFTRKIRVTTMFQDVGGLKVGDNVWFSGVKVGTVKKLAFHGGADVQVELKIDQEAAPFLPDDALAKISSDGLIGSRLVILYGGTRGATPLKDGDVVATGKSLSTDDILTTLQANNQNLELITGRLARGEGSVGKLLQDDALYADVRSTVASITATSDTARGATRSVAVFAEKLNRPGQLPNDLVTDRTTWPSVKASVASLHAASGRASDLADGLATSTADPSTPVGILLHDRPAGAHLQESVANLHRGTTLMDEDLLALQHNFLLRGYFRKQERAAARAQKLADKAARNADATSPAADTLATRSTP
jgi:phospholipid/cholesterol/gamma-HCH transport system substrate-binding protein